MIKAICVRTGTKYPLRYVLHMQRMVAKHLSAPHEFICLTDQETDTAGLTIKFIDIRQWKLHGWFAKMLLFNEAVTGPGPILYIDLDMVVAGSLDPLAALDVDFGVCQNFTQIRQMREGGRVTWPCRYGSCVVLLGAYWSRRRVWEAFEKDSWAWISRARQFGDQWIMEQIQGDAAYLQDRLPPGYFLHYRDFTEAPDPAASILVFAGKEKPATCKIGWISRHWYCSEKDNAR